MGIEPMSLPAWSPCAELNSAPGGTKAVHRHNASGAIALGAGAVNRTPTTALQMRRPRHGAPPASRTIRTRSVIHLQRAGKPLFRVDGCRSSQSSRGLHGVSSVLGREGATILSGRLRVLSLCRYLAGGFGTRCRLVFAPLGAIDIRDWFAHGKRPRPL